MFEPDLREFGDLGHTHFLVQGNAGGIRQGNTSNDRVNIKRAQFFKQSRIKAGTPSLENLYPAAGTPYFLPKIGKHCAPSSD